MKFKCYRFSLILSLLMAGLWSGSATAEDKLLTSYGLNTLGVFTRASELMWCDALAGDWGVDPKWGGSAYCYGPPKATLTDENIGARAVVGIDTNYSNKECGRAWLGSDTGWTLGKLTIPPELNEYFDSVTGVYSPNNKKWNRLIRVDYLTNRFWPPESCTVTQSNWWLATKSIERVKAACDPQYGNPIRPYLGEKIQKIDFSSQFGVPFNLHYSSGRRPTLKGGSGGWSYSVDIEIIKELSSSGEEYAIIQGRDFDVELKFVRAGDVWNKTQRTDAVLVNDKNGNTNLLDRERGVVYKFVGSELSEKMDRSGDGYVFTYDSPKDIDGRDMPRKLVRINSIKSGRFVDFRYEWIFRGGDSAVGSTLKKIVSNGGDVDVSTDPISGYIRSVTLPDGKVISYEYNEAGRPWLLSKVFREDGKVYGMFKYDDAGRAVSTLSSGEIAEFSVVFADESGVGNSSILVSNPNGGSSKTILTTRVIDGENLRLPLRTDQPGGSGCAASSASMSYDDRGNRVSAIDFSGRRTCSAYDSNRNLETTRLEGLLEADTCPADLPSYTVPANLAPDKAQRKIHTQWHPVWHLKTREAEPKRVTTWVYNGQPDPLNNNVEASCAPADALLPDGSKIAVLCKRYEQATSDETGNLGFAAPVLSTRSWSTTYNQHGQVLTETDPRGKTTSYEYWADTSFPAGDNNPAGEARGHTLGDLKLVSRPGNQTTRHTHYNKRGQVLRTELPNGGVEEREYHLRGWLTKVKQRATATATASLDTQYEYYPTGLLKLVTQADGSWQRYEYDDAHRLTDVIDSLGNKVHYALDNAGNATQESHTDPSGVLVKAISRTYDTLGRLQSQKLGAP